MTGRPGAEGDPLPADASDLDLDERVRRLVQALADTQHLAREAQQRVGARAELDELRASCGTGGPDRPGSRFAAIYDDFTDRFRGSTAEVSAKLEGYLPDIEVRALHPKPSPVPRFGGGGVSPPMHELLTHLLWGPQDYAVLGYKLPNRAG